jgi:hypothetical protein
MRRFDPGAIWKAIGHNNTVRFFAAFDHTDLLLRTPDFGRGTYPDVRTPPANLQHGGRLSAMPSVQG